MNNDFKLNENHSKSPFIIPEGYLDNLPDEVMKKIREKETSVSSSPVQKILHIIRPQLAFAAGFLALALVIYTAVNFILRREDIRVSEDQMFSHLIEYAGTQLEENLLYEYLAETDNLNTEGINSDYTDLIIDYLLKENIEYGSLLMEL